MGDGDGAPAQASFYRALLKKRNGPAIGDDADSENYELQLHADNPSSTAQPRQRRKRARKIPGAVPAAPQQALQARIEDDLAVSGHCECECEPDKPFDHLSANQPNLVHHCAHEDHTESWSSSSSDGNDTAPGPDHIVSESESVCIVDVPAGSGKSAAAPQNPTRRRRRQSHTSTPVPPTVTTSTNTSEHEQAVHLADIVHDGCNAASLGGDVGGGGRTDSVPDALFADQASSSSAVPTAGGAPVAAPDSVLLRSVGRQHDQQPAPASRPPVPERGKGNGRGSRHGRLGVGLSSALNERTTFFGLFMLCFREDKYCYWVKCPFHSFKRDGRQYVWPGLHCYNLQQFVYSYVVLTVDC